MAARLLMLMLGASLFAAGCAEGPSERAEPTPPAAENTASPTPAPAPAPAPVRPTPKPDAAPELDPYVEWITEDRAAAQLGGELFSLEVADTFSARVRGLSFRDEIPVDGGMVFVFPDKAILDFVMRDCRVPIDIAYTTDTGRIVMMHTMEIQPRIPGELDGAYERRLTRYTSKFPVRFAFEFKAGTLERLGIAEGDVIVADFTSLKARAR